MDAQNYVRVRTAPMVAFTGAVVIATATAVSAPPVQRAAENIAPAVVHEVKSLPVQLTAYNPFVPYAQPVGVVGYALLALLHPQHQFWHDAICGTQLVDAKPEPQRKP